MTQAKRPRPALEHGERVRGGIGVARIEIMDSIALAAGTLSASDKSWLGAMTVEDIRVTGSSATGRIAGKPAVPTAVRSRFGSENLTFRNESERWELDGVSP